MNDSVSYSEPVLCHYNYDLKRSWFVYFDITNKVTGETLRRQFRGGINYFKTKEERLYAANALKRLWKTKLEKGEYNPFGNHRIDTPSTVALALEKIIALKRSSLKPKSIRNYKNVTNMLVKWLKQDVYIDRFSNQVAQSYMDHLLLQRNYSGKSYNNQLAILKSIFNSMKGRKWVIENPFTGIVELPEDIGNNIAYTDHEAKQLIKYFKEHDKRMYYAINFIFHGFIRKTEICELRVGDIDFENLSIRLSETKNRLQDSITITEGLLKILYEMGLDMAPKHFYIFGRGMKTCERKCNRPHDISDRHLKIKKAFIASNTTTLRIDDGKTFYSWKHSGVIAYWKIVKDIYYLMRQIRHSDMKITMIYLKSLGLMPNEAFRNARIEL